MSNESMENCELTLKTLKYDRKENNAVQNWSKSKSTEDVSNTQLIYEKCIPSHVTKLGGAIRLCHLVIS